MSNARTVDIGDGATVISVIRVRLSDGSDVFDVGITQGYHNGGVPVRLGCASESDAIRIASELRDTMRGTLEDVPDFVYRREA